MFPQGSQDPSVVVVLLAGPPERVTGWYSAFMADNRFRVASFATDTDSFILQLAGNPEVVLVDASLFSGPPPLIEALTKVSGSAYVVLPSMDENQRQTIAAVPSVKGVYAAESFNLESVISQIHANALARRQMAPSVGDWGTQKREAVSATTGLRIITVWNQCGGSGKTTIATNLAYEASRRGIRTLFIGLGAPDIAPLLLGLNASPNITLWRTNPVPQALKQAIQKIGDLDVLAGFPDVLAEGQLLMSAPDAENSLTKLVMTAAYEGYACIVLDAPHSQAAGLALAASNTLILVARPTLADAWCTVEAWRTLQERMAGKHRIAPQNVLVALNRCRSGSMTAAEWHGDASRVWQRPFPAIGAVFPEDFEVERAQEQGKLPLLMADSFAKPLVAVANSLFGAKTGYADASGKRLSVGTLFNVRVKR
jgi:arsenite/tail-anchored protein-transporting ATPase